ncbi:hypothetical protein CH63R_14468 [Colletotrichum higginsianum IMI 349063]|uniref:Uncharacterized protein n=1 Tax=Colletotrichum higginsianum (strain IMI 349063) TaxID=759273 RepID=A0A1B7XQY2_COLHI|nr:hypothetical protein CH63R_14468 [Colletotrichum higginsianum IMI 349063]OBR02167.1 hypothetical protein CH63R_14468 [Colletotrichum higginsianum IMI 349063]
MLLRSAPTILRLGRITTWVTAPNVGASAPSTGSTFLLDTPHTVYDAYYAWKHGLVPLGASTVREGKGNPSLLLLEEPFAEAWATCQTALKLIFLSSRDADGANERLVLPKLAHLYGLHRRAEDVLFHVNAADAAAVFRRLAEPDSGPGAEHGHRLDYLADLFVHADLVIVKRLDAALNWRHKA